MFFRSLDQTPHSNNFMRPPWRKWSLTCFRGKTDSFTLMVSPILERLTLFKVRLSCACVSCTCFSHMAETVFSAQQIFAGTGREAGLLPRALASLFKKLQGRLYGALDLKPVMYQDVRQLSAGEVKVEEIRRNSLLKEVKRKAVFIFNLLVQWKKS